MDSEWHGLSECDLGARARHRFIVESGISTAEITAFLERNAHARMHTQTPTLPETVVNMINLWAKERDRVTFHAVHLVEGFQSHAEWKAAEAYAKDNRVLLWSRGDAEKLDRNAIAVNSAAVKQIKSFLQSWRRRDA